MSVGFHGKVSSFKFCQYMICTNTFHSLNLTIFFQILHTINVLHACILAMNGRLARIAITLGCLVLKYGSHEGDLKTTN